MQYRPLGNTGLQVSALGLGGNTFGPPRLDRLASIRTIHHALDLGVNLIDTAHLYNQGASETYLGEALQGRRDGVVLATKFHLHQLAAGESVAQRIRGHCETSLERLRTDRLDLLQLHFTAAGVPAEAILEPLAALVQAGKVRFIGTCNYSAWRNREALAVAAAHGWPTVACTQNQYNLLARQVEPELLPFCQAYGVGFLPYFPLAGGFLTGKYQAGAPAPEGSRGAAGSPIIRRSRTGPNEALLEALRAWAQAHARTLPEIAIGWLLACPAVSSVIAGAMSPQQLDTNAQAAGRPLSPQEYEAVNVLLAEHKPPLDPVEAGLDSFR